MKENVPLLRSGVIIDGPGYKHFASLRRGGYKDEPTWSDLSAVLSAVCPTAGSPTSSAQNTFLEAPEPTRAFPG